MLHEVLARAHEKELTLAQFFQGGFRVGMCLDFMQAPQEFVGAAAKRQLDDVVAYLNDK